VLIRTTRPIPYSEVTPEAVYHSRRDFLRLAAATGAGVVAGPLLAGCAANPQAAQAMLDYTRNEQFSLTSEPPSTFEQITQYNNFYEFGTDKSDPYRNAGRLTVTPWTVRIDGHVNKPGEYSYDDIVKPQALEERIYRLRCVEAWSAVIPWIGFPLAALLNRVEPTSRARYVAFETLERPSEMPGQRTNVLEWPYVEGLRLDEAMHPLTLLAVGLYGRELPNQNGAPIRLVVPWKYGFKSIKSVVRIQLVESQPPTSWNIANTREYGFYSNVNPEVDHPRWSQARERRLGSFLANRRTEMFNGYADEVGQLYAGMDLRRDY